MTGFRPLVSDDMNGPNRPLNQPSDAAVRLPQTSRWCMVHHFCRLKRRCADEADKQSCLPYRENLLQFFESFEL